MSGSFKYRHHVEPKVKLYSPIEESFPIPLKCIDVSRTTRTNLDVMQERRIDDHRNIDGSTDLSDSWTSFTRFISLEEKPPDGNMWSGETLTKRQVISRPDYLWPELGRNDNLRSRNGSVKNRNSIMLEEYEEQISLTQRTRNLKKHQWLPPRLARQARRVSMGRPVARLRVSNQNLRVSWKASESTSMRVEESPPNYHEYHFAGKGDSSLQYYNLVHKFIPMPQKP